MKHWNSFNQPPVTALKKIEAGRMKGKSDINPQWRYKAMTEEFGTVGVGWKFTIEKMWTETAANNEVMAFVNVSVFIKEDGAWSDAIPGTGGSTLIVSEKNGMYNDDDAFKKATTDALSTAMKMLGVAADVYMGIWDGAKYRETSEPVRNQTKREKLVARYTDRIVRAAAIGIDTKAWELTDKMTDDEIGKLGVALNAEITKQEGKENA
jgi:hypothetical protein